MLTCIDVEIFATLIKLLNKLNKKTQRIQYSRMINRLTFTIFIQLISNLSEHISNFTTERLYKSSSVFNVNQTVDLSRLSRYVDNTIFTIHAFRYACGGSISILKEEIVNGNYAGGFTILAQNPTKYWCFKLDANFNLTLVSNNADGLPYVTVTRN